MYVHLFSAKQAKECEEWLSKYSRILYVTRSPCLIKWTCSLHFDLLNFTKNGMGLKQRVIWSLGQGLTNEANEKSKH
mgnify:CR=1 FL=1